MAKKLKIGLIGCGGMMGYHAGQLLASKKAEVAALTDPNQKMLEGFVGRFPALNGVPQFKDYREMLKKAELDGVVISSPHTVHCEQIIGSLGRGLHVLCEKPMVCSVADAKKVIAKAKSSGKILMTAYQRHFAPAYRLARKMIAKGDLGKIHTIAALQAQDWYRLTTGSWRQKPELSGGGQLNDSGSHLVDIVLWMSDLAPAEAFAYEEFFKSKVDIDTAAVVKFKGGALATFTVVGHSPGWWEDISIWGEEGVFYIRDGRLLHVSRDKQQNWNAKREDLTDKLKYSNSPVGNFVDSILGKDVPQTPAECGLRVIQLTQALWESAAAGKPVKVRT